MEPVAKSIVIDFQRKVPSDAAQYAAENLAPLATDIS